MSNMTFAPLDGDIADTVELFQTKYRRTSSSIHGFDSDGDTEDTRDFEGRQVGSPPAILPSGWRKRLHKPGSVYQYSKTEVMEYNEMVYLHGEAVAKRWADRRWHDRTKRNA